VVSGAGAVGLACAEPSAAGPVIGLALGSGAARGWAHLGVLQELAREGVAATLMAVKAAEIFVGAAAASGGAEPVFLSAEQVERIAGRPDEHYRQKALGL